MTNLHTIKAPSGKFIFVGMVPAALMVEQDATKSDVMGGRAYRRDNGTLATRRTRSFNTEAEALAYAAVAGFECKVPVKG